MLGFVVKAFLDVVHASLTAGAEHKEEQVRNVNKSDIKQGLIERIKKV